MKNVNTLMNMECFLNLWCYQLKLRSTVEWVLMCLIFWTAIIKLNILLIHYKTRVLFIASCFMIVLKGSVVPDRSVFVCCFAIWISRPCHTERGCMGTIYPLHTLTALYFSISHVYHIIYIFNDIMSSIAGRYLQISEFISRI